MKHLTTYSQYDNCNRCGSKFFFKCSTCSTKMLSEHDLRALAKFKAQKIAKEKILSLLDADLMRS